MLEASIAREGPSLSDVPRPAPSHPPGWAWLRPFRRLDEYQLALSELGVARADELELRDDAVARSAQ
jgi:hypothetical protein